MVNVCECSAGGCSSHRLASPTRSWRCAFPLAFCEMCWFLKHKSKANNSCNMCFMAHCPQHAHSARSTLYMGLCGHLYILHSNYCSLGCSVRIVHVNLSRPSQHAHFYGAQIWKYVRAMWYFAKPIWRACFINIDLLTNPSPTSGVCSFTRAIAPHCNRTLQPAVKQCTNHITVCARSRAADARSHGGE